MDSHFSKLNSARPRCRFDFGRLRETKLIVADWFWFWCAARTGPKWRIRIVNRNKEFSRRESSVKRWQQLRWRTTCARWTSATAMRESHAPHAEGRRHRRNARNATRDVPRRVFLDMYQRALCTLNESAVKLWLQTQQTRLLNPLSRGSLLRLRLREEGPREEEGRGGAGGGGGQRRRNGRRNHHWRRADIAKMERKEERKFKRKLKGGPGLKYVSHAEWEAAGHTRGTGGSKCRGTKSSIILLD